MENEPRRLPTYAGEIQKDRWYCFHCDQHRPDAPTLRIHLDAKHDVDSPVRGVDYGDGSMTAFIHLRHKLWESEAPEHFALELNSLAGADDFAFEVGKGAPDA